MWISEPKTKKAKKAKVDFESSYPNYLVLMCFIAYNIRIPYDVISGSFPVGKDRRLNLLIPSLTFMPSLVLIP